MQYAFPQRKQTQKERRIQNTKESSHQLQVLGENEKENFHPIYLECDKNAEFTQGSFSSLQNPQALLTQVSIPPLYTLNLIIHLVVTALG